MSVNQYKLAYETAKRDLTVRLKKRSRLDREIRELVDGLKPLAVLCHADPQELDDLLFAEGLSLDLERGFTSTIRSVFRSHKAPLTPLVIRNELLNMGVGREQVNLLASIHIVLRRMVVAGEIKKNQDSTFTLINKA